MKSLKNVLLLAGVSLSAGVAAAPSVQFSDWARVVSSTPRYEEINAPRQVCRRETIQAPTAQRDVAGAVIGGLAGGILGGQVGKGNGRIAAAAIGAATGAMVGDRLQASPSEPRVVERCDWQDDYRTRITGYDVVYEYQGRTYSSIMNQAPGAWLRLQVSLKPE